MLGEQFKKKNLYTIKKKRKRKSYTKRRKLTPPVLGEQLVQGRGVQFCGELFQHLLEGRLAFVQLEKGRKDYLMRFQKIKGKGKRE